MRATLTQEKLARRPRKASEHYRIILASSAGLLPIIAFCLSEPCLHPAATASAYFDSELIVVFGPIFNPAAFSGLIISSRLIAQKTAFGSIIFTTRAEPVRGCPSRLIYVDLLLLEKEILLNQTPQLGVPGSQTNAFTSDLAASFIDDYINSRFYCGKMILAPSLQFFTQRPSPRGMIWTRLLRLHGMWTDARGAECIDLLHFRQ